MYHSIFSCSDDGLPAAGNVVGPHHPRKLGLVKYWVLSYLQKGSSSLPSFRYLLTFWKPLGSFLEAAEN